MVKVLMRDRLERKVAVIVGTRPGIIKLSPVIRELIKRDVPHSIIHTGQHYSPVLDAVFFRDLQIPAPDVQLPSLEGHTGHGDQTAEMLRGIEQALLAAPPAAVIIGGDANTNLAAALAARKLNIQVCHDEAGLRSYDWLMPEEHNRVMMDHISEFLFAPNERARQVLENEQVRGRIVVTGSTIVDAVTENLALARTVSTVLRELNVTAGAYLLMTIHHEETVDYSDTLASVIEGASRVACRFDRPVVFPAHPRTYKRLREFGLLERVVDSPEIRMVEPLGYLDFLTLHAHAALTLTDSGGGIQEAAILGVPCLTLGRTTEWQEVVEAGANLICGTEAEQILLGAEAMLGASGWTNPFGEPGAAARIVDVIEDEALAGDGYLPARPDPVSRIDLQMAGADS